MTDDFETEALHYVLDELDADRRAAFEERLARDPQQRAALKACTDSLTGFACDTAPAEPMAAADQRAALSAILAQTAGSATVRREPKKIVSWPRYVWPIAAALLLALNLVEFERPFAPQPASQEAVTRNELPESVAATSAGNAAMTTQPRDRSAADQTKDNLGTDAKAGDELLVEARENARELAKLRADYATLQRTTNVLRADYDGLVRHFADRVLLEKSIGRLATMELVDAATYARGDRRGLTDVARGILTAPGVVVPVDSSSPPPQDTPSEPGFSSAGITPDEPAPAPAPYAWSVFDDKEGRGYLNLYNLPHLASDQSLQLWVKPVDGVNYVRVGEVPAAFHGGNGSVQYTLPEQNTAPAEILITVEPRGEPAPQPTGATVLRGP
jgi:anti-sigma-K factor RskA